MSKDNTEPGTNDGSELPALASAMPGVAIASVDRTLTAANPEFLEITRFSSDDLIGQPLTFLFHHEIEPTCAAAVLEALEAEREYSAKVHAVRRTGERFWATLDIMPVRAPDGGLIHFVVIVRDLSTSSEAELALEATNRRFRDLLDHLPAGVVVHGRDSRILAANRIAGELIGISVDQMIGRSARDAAWRLLRDDGAPMAVDEFPVCRALSTHSSLSNIVVGIVRDNAPSPLWVICNTYVVCNDKGELSEAVVCFTDCTELKHTEQSLQKSEERLRLVLQGSNDAPWDWDLRTGELYYSARWWQMIGRAPDELPLDATLWRRLLHPDDQDPVVDAFEQALAGQSNVYEIEARMQHRDGHYVPILSRGFILRDDRGKPVRVSGTNTDLTERKEAERHIHQLAYFDHLTGLPNRRFLMDQLHKMLSRCARTGQVGALLFIDLDNFKLLNDTLGHDVGDLLLRQVAYRLRHAVRESDDVARLGGDEFVIVLENLGATAAVAAAEADLVGNKLLAVCGETYALPARVYRSTPSIGIALFHSRTESIDVLLKQADLAMYQAKAAGRNTLRFFDPVMQAAIDRRYEMEHDLREGLLRKEFLLYCQPQFDGAGALLGAEVLLRWRHPQRGLVGPAEFIALAEATGLVLPVGLWVLRESCKHLARWSADPVLRDVSLAVNVSAQQMHAADFAGQTLAIIADSGADPRRLSLELTESMLAQNIEDVIEKMSRLKRAGVNFSIDDFGTGYSSLSYLKRFPLATLKIDQSFVHDIHTDPNAAAIVEVIITLARKLGLKVIAEGVEAEGQRAFLRASGCDAFQGYLLGKPMPIDDFERQFGAQ